MVYEYKKLNISKSKNKNKKYFLYNRASYDPNISNYNAIRKKKFLKQSITTIDLFNNKKNNLIDLKEIFKKHTRHYSGINPSILNNDNNICKFIPNKLKNIIRNSYILNNNNSHTLDRNSINMKIINSLNRSYDNNFYNNLNKLNNQNNYLGNSFNEKDFEPYISQNKNIS